MWFDDFLPQSEAAGERVLVAAAARAGGEWFNEFGVAAAEQHVVRHERLLQHRRDLRHRGDPLLLAVCFEAGVAQSIEDRFARTIREAAKL